jgi:hypothetical protein
VVLFGDGDTKEGKGTRVAVPADGGLVGGVFHVCKIKKKGGEKKEEKAEKPPVEKAGEEAEKPPPPPPEEGGALKARMAKMAMGAGSGGPQVVMAEPGVVRRMSADDAELEGEVGSASPPQEKEQDSDEEGANMLVVVEGEEAQSDFERAGEPAKSEAREHRRDANNLLLSFVLASLAPTRR